jgi:hypothetical protein
MKKIVRLKESDLHRIVKRVIRESQNPILNELGGMDDGHPFSGSMNFNDLSSDDREKVNKYYRVDDGEVGDSFSELDSELEDDFEDDEYPKPSMRHNREYPKPSMRHNRNSEIPFRPRPFNRD